MWINYSSFRRILKVEFSFTHDPLFVQLKISVHFHVKHENRFHCIHARSSRSLLSNWSTSIRTDLTLNFAIRRPKSWLYNWFFFFSYYLSTTGRNSRETFHFNFDLLQKKHKEHRQWTTQAANHKKFHEKKKEQIIVKRFVFYFSRCWWQWHWNYAVNTKYKIQYNNKQSKTGVSLIRRNLEQLRGIN